MVESRDSMIKLFGKTIQLPAVKEVLVTLGEESVDYQKKVLSNNQENHEPHHKNEEARIYQQEESIGDLNISNTNEEKNNPMHKTLKKPDKILPCPRCRSMDTKFCYFNNYNVNQPRHFCKNCQRYWTEGGSMRNVPVGAGRRKSKSSITNHHITIPDCLQADAYESISYLSPLKPNGTIISFDAEAPLCELMDFNGDDQLSRSLVPNPWSYAPFYPMNPYLGLPWLCSGLSSTVLGKHYREGNMLNNSNSVKDDHAKSEKSLWIPKISRINEHEKAAKCSVWGKLGFSNDKADRGLKTRSAEASQVLSANPAALSRSISFQERS